MGGGGEEPLHVLGGAGVARTGAWAWSTLNKAELGTRLVLLKLKEKRVKIVEIENLCPVLKGRRTSVIGDRCPFSFCLHVVHLRFPKKAC